MVFSTRVTTPANTTENNPMDTVLKCSSGLIYQVEIMFPPGSSGLMGVRIRSQNVSLYPRNRDEWFIGDNYVYSFPDLFELYVDSNEINIMSYNVDTDYAHLCTVSLGIVSRADYIEHFLPGQATKALIESMEHLSSLVNVNTPSIDWDLINIISTSGD